MTLKDRINNEYFEWMYKKMFGESYSKELSYRKLLIHLHNVEFIFTIPKDQNRAEDGISLRYRFALINGYEDEYDYLDGPCSILEMMVALAIRCEENIMDDPNVGDRTGQWFWNMVVSLGLGHMTDIHYDRRFVDEVLDKFLEREYEPNGKGGLFTIRNCGRDLRTVEIWYQLCWYLDSLI